MRWLAVVALAGCGHAPPSHGDDAPPGDGAASDTPEGLDAGSLDVAWMHGSPECASNTEPEWQLHAYNATTFVLRQNKCDTFEAPFVYLLVGTDRALLLDTGATNSDALRQRIAPHVGSRALVVAHTHAHGDHVSGDSRFTNQPNTTVVGRDVASVQAAFAIAPWPGDEGGIELGDRAIDALGLPGHEQSHIALYDRRTGLLFTGDTLYPGYLFVDNWGSYRDSIARLAAFAASRPVTHVLGAHVEMTATPMQPYPYGETYQPDEHVLQLSAAHLAELATTLDELGATPPAQAIRKNDYVIVPP